MRKSTYVVLASMALWAAVAASACGSDVTNNPTSSSGGGGKDMTTSAQSGSSSAASSSSSKAASSSSSAAASSSSGGGDNCTMACAHVQMCVGIDPCQFMMFDCSDPQNDCIAKCVINTPCNMLNMGTFTTCQNMCSSDGGAVDGGMSDGGGAQACQNCATSQCGAEAFACFNDAQCGQWLMCLQGCGNQPNPATCANACDTMYSGAAGLYGPVYSCTCNKCTSECKDIDPCSHVAG